jgi:ubiquinone/menaquinone biosynthesis C-methylase UbiE
MSNEIKYNKIGIGYNQTRKADKFLTERLYHFLNPKNEGVYLDIGCGTGNYTIALNKKGVSLIGIDPSAEMLLKAREKNNSIDWRFGTAEETGLADKSIDGIIATLTVHHWSNLEKSFAEMGRAMKSSSRVVIFTSTPQQMETYWLNHYFPKMIKDSAVPMPTVETIATLMKKANIDITTTEKYFVKPDLEDQFLQCGKDAPELYLREDIRKGISSFASAKDPVEVRQGLLELKKDIESGKIKEIIKSFESNEGDYLFVVGEKQ